MIARIGRRHLIIQEAYSHWDLQDVLGEVNPILVSGGYKPVYFFEGTPVLGQGGFSVLIKLERELSDRDKRIIARLLGARGIRVFEEA